MPIIAIHMPNFALAQLNKIIKGMAIKIGKKVRLKA